MRLQFLDDLKTSTRVALSLALVLLLMAVVMGASLTRMGGLTRDIDALAAERVPKMLLATQAIEALWRGGRHIRNAMLHEDEAQVSTELATAGRVGAQVAELLGQVAGRVSSDEERALFAAVSDAQRAHGALEGELQERMRRGDRAGARTLVTGRLGAAQARFMEAMDAFLRYQATAVGNEAQARGDSQRQWTLLLGAVSAIALVVVLAAMYGVTRGIALRFGERSYAAGMAGAIASGDLTKKVAVGRNDDAIVLEAMQKMRDDLAATVSAIRLVAESVGESSRTVAMGNAELSSRTEQQATSLEQTAASMEELASTVKQNADNALRAEQLAESASERAERGGQEVGRVVATMGEISDSSARIADIISVIDGIAFQTNILALNAAVEAARAGEQGRGFAVVAAEVRALARRSADAAREIKTLIEASVERVGNGRLLVEQAGGTINALVADAREVRDLMRSIAEASAEQSRGVQQVNQTVTEMDRVVQENANGVHQSAAAAEALRRQAEALLAAVSSFKLAAEDERVAAGGVAGEPAPAPTPPAPTPPAPQAAPGRMALAVSTGEDEWREF